MAHARKIIFARARIVTHAPRRTQTFTAFDSFALFVNTDVARRTAQVRFTFSETLEVPASISATRVFVEGSAFGL